MNNRLCRPVDLTINANWKKIRDVYNFINGQRINGKLDKDSLSVPEYNAVQYNLGTHGSLILALTLSDDWCSWGGEMLSNLLPWSNKIHEMFAPLDLCEIVLSVTYTDIKLHIDSKRDGEEEREHCKLNYIVTSEDVNGKTWIYDRDDPTYSEYYPSIPGKAYLIDVTHPHKVDSNAYREVLQFKFWNTFEEVASVLDRLGPITLK